MTASVTPTTGAAVTAPMRKLFEHLAWADARVLEGLRRSPGGDPRALEIYAHLVAAEHVWLSRIEREAPRVGVWPTLTLDDCESLNAESLGRFRALLDSGPSRLATQIDYTNSAGQSFRSTIEDILLHVALHGTYHRGQVALLVREGGGEPVPTDYIALARGAPAATRADSR